MRAASITALLVLLGTAPAAAPAPAEVQPVLAVQPLAGSYKAKASDNICGLRDLRQLSSPAKVNFGKLMKATPEMKKMKDQGIKPDSAEGIKLKNEANDRVRKACKKVMGTTHCSVWKKISHTDKDTNKRIKDITDAVLKQM